MSQKSHRKEELLEEQIMETTVGQGELCDALEAACAAMRKGPRDGKFTGERWGGGPRGGSYLVSQVAMAFFGRCCWFLR